MVDVPETDFPLMEKLTQETFGGNDDEIAAGAGQQVSAETAARLWQEAVDGFYDYFDGMVQDRHANPRDDVATAIVTGRLADGGLMSPKRQNHMLSSLAIAGHDTVNAALAGGLLGLCRFPDQLRLVRDNPSLIPGLVEESLRYGTPTKHFIRTVSRDTELRGVPLTAGDRVMILHYSANMDEDVFADPERFDVTRRPNPHLTFGFGPHICLGMHVAKIEMRILFEELVPRITSLALDGPLRRKRANFVTSIKTMPVRFTAA
jgi:alpha-terpineol hydroxylase